MAIVNTVKMVKIRRKKHYPAFLFPFSIYIYIYSFLFFVIIGMIETDTGTYSLLLSVDVTKMLYGKQYSP